MPKRSNSLTLNPICDNIWSVDGRFKLLPGVLFPARSTIVRLSSGGLLVHSPLGFDAEMAEQIEALGSVETILAPTIWHSSHVRGAQKLFPRAEVFAVPGMGKKLEGVDLAGEVQDALPASLAKDFSHELIRGAPKANEVALFHKPTGSLIVADFFFNIQSWEGLFTSLVLTLNGGKKKATQSKLWRSWVDDKQAFAASCNVVLDWDAQRVIMGHGDVIEGDTSFTKAALDWVL